MDPARLHFLYVDLVMKVKKNCKPTFYETYLFCYFNVVFTLKGECGLDFTPYYIKSASDKDEQRQLLKYQADLSNQFNLPL